MLFVFCVFLCFSKKFPLFLFQCHCPCFVCFCVFVYLSSIAVFTLLVLPSLCFLCFFSSFLSKVFFFKICPLRGGVIISTVRSPIPHLYPAIRPYMSNSSTTVLHSSLTWYLSLFVPNQTMLLLQHAVPCTASIPLHSQ